MYRYKISWPLLLIISILICTPAPVLAKTPDSGDALEKNQMVISEEHDIASNAEELMSWVDKHKYTGGYLLLSADINLEGYTALTHSPYAEAAVIDLNGFSIIADGMVEILNMSFANQGDTGTFLAMQGSQVYFSSGILQDASGPLFLQEEGAFLYIDDTVVCEEESIQYAQIPVAGQLLEQPGTLLVESGESVQDRLPGLLSAEVCYQGKMEVQQIPVKWELQDEHTAEALENRLRSIVKGRFDFPHTDEPLCTLAFRNQPVTFLDADIKGNDNAQIIFLSFTVPEYPMEVELQYSSDGKQYYTVQQKIVLREDECYGTWSFSAPQYWSEGYILWDTDQYPTAFLRVKWLECTNESDKYSDVLCLDFSSLKLSADIGGNRGGGTDIVNPPTTPAPEPSPAPETPPVEIPDTDKPSETDPPSLPNPPSGSDQPSLPSLPSGSDQSPLPSLPSRSDQPLDSDKSSEVEKEAELPVETGQEDGSGESSFVRKKTDSPASSMFSTLEGNNSKVFQGSLSAVPATESQALFSGNESAENAKEEQTFENVADKENPAPDAENNSLMPPILAALGLSALCMSAAGFWLHPLAFGRLAKKIMSLHKKKV